MLRFVGNKYRQFSYELFKAQTRIFLDARTAAPKPSNGKEALNYVRTLYENKDYEAALQKLTQVVELFPDCSKAAAHYRSKISMALLDLTACHLRGMETSRLENDLITPQARSNRKCPCELLRSLH